MPKSPALTYAKAYDIILHNQNLTALERLVLTVISRFWPDPCSMSNETIAQLTGLSVRKIQYILKDLSTGPTKRITHHKSHRRAYIIREYEHITHHAKTYTTRLIFPIFLPGPRRRHPKSHKSPQTRGGAAKPVSAYL